jgi:hypothetical protein
MKWLVALALVSPAIVSAAQPEGIDVSSHQPGVNWASVKANGVEFAYIKATEGTSACYFSGQMTGRWLICLLSTCNSLQEPKLQLPVYVCVKIDHPLQLF